MGGGALKLEATHLRRLLLPKVDVWIRAMSNSLLGEAIACQGLSVDISHEVDRLVGQILSISEVRMSRLRRLALGLLEVRTPRARSLMRRNAKAKLTRETCQPRPRMGKS